MTSCLKKSAVIMQTFSKYVQIRRISRSVSALNLSVPQPSGEPKAFSPKIEQIAESIAKLNLLEVAELTDLLKQKLNLPDAPVMGFAAGAMPVASAGTQEESAEVKNVQTSFQVKLTGFDEKQKVPLIKEIKQTVEGLNLVQAKKFVESVPIVVKNNIGKDEAEKLKEALSKVGGVVEII